MVREFTGGGNSAPIEDRMRRRSCQLRDKGEHMITKQFAWGLRLATAVVSLLAAVDVMGYDGPVEKQVFALPAYTTVGGKTLKNVRIGYETYGKLNAAGDNAIFIPHFFSGNSHAAGKYKPGDAAPGYWDRSSAPVSRSIPTSISWSAPIHSPT